MHRWMNRSGFSEEMRNGMFLTYFSNEPCCSILQLACIFFSNSSLLMVTAADKQRLGAQGDSKSIRRKLPFILALTPDKVIISQPINPVLLRTSASNEQCFSLRPFCLRSPPKPPDRGWSGVVCFDFNDEKSTTLPLRWDAPSAVTTHRLCNCITLKIKARRREHKRSFHF